MTVRAAGVVAAGSLLAACGTTVSGHPVASRSPITAVQTDGGLARLLPDPSQFPSSYTAIALPPDSAGEAAADLEGMLPGATVDPAACAPATPTAGPVVSVGTDDNTRSTLTVELIRTDKKLSSVRDQLQQCGTVRIGHAGTTATVTTKMDPAPPSNADDTLALNRTVESARGGPGLTRSMQTLLGQIGDVRVSVTYMTFGDGKPDTGALDALFTTALRKVRKG
ncbi:sensor domain-containing protein [Nocardia sp. NPDC088792]|uniref:sensor domain-containing protein n=1 Tax=Nocardia sp. NPDC088792 TaxID=3364332 RepID=UPI0037F82737